MRSGGRWHRRPRSRCGRRVPRTRSTASRSRRARWSWWFPGALWSWWSDPPRWSSWYSQSPAPRWPSPWRAPGQGAQHSIGVASRCLLLIVEDGISRPGCAAAPSPARRAAGQGAPAQSLDTGRSVQADSRGTKQPGSPISASARCRLRIVCITRLEPVGAQSAELPRLRAGASDAAELGRTWSF